MTLRRRVAYLFAWASARSSYAHASGIYISPGYEIILCSIPLSLIAAVVVAQRLSRGLIVLFAAFVAFVILCLCGAAVVLESTALTRFGDNRVLMEFIVLVVVPFIGSTLVTWCLLNVLPARFRKSRNNPKEHGLVRHAKTEKALRDGRAAAAQYLVNPTYISDYAKSAHTNLEAVHALIRTGKLLGYWHDGILFVGDKRSDVPNPPLQGTRDEAARP